MPVSPDDAAASDAHSGERRAGGAVVSGNSREPEVTREPGMTPAMPQRPADQDETVRMPSERPGGSRPPVGGSRAPVQDSGAPTPAEASPDAPPADATPADAPPADATPAEGPPAEADVPAPPTPVFDDTRPVSRDWLSGAPEPASGGVHQAAPAADAQPPQPASPDSASAVGSADDTLVTERPRDDAPGRHATAVVDLGPRAGEGGPGSPGSPGQPPPGAGSADGPRRPWFRRGAVLVPAGVVAALAVLYGADLALAAGDIPRNTVVAGIDIGSRSPADASAALEERLAPRVAAERTVVAGDVTATILPAAAGIALDVDATVDAADEQPLSPWARLTTLFSERQVQPVLTADETALAAQLETIAAQVDLAPADATIAIEGTTPGVVEPVEGRTLDRDGAATTITGALSDGGDPETPIELPVDVEPARVPAEEAQRVLDELVTPALAAPVQIVSSDGDASAEVPVAAIAASLRFTSQDDGGLVADVDPAELKEALGDRLSAFGQPAEDARFEISGGSVDVVPSVDGTGVDPQRLADQLLPVLPEPAPRSVTAELGPVPADVTTEEAEALGIVEEISSFTTNISNPRSGTNIRVVAEEVDGALVLPGETFSLNEFTGPRGVAQGYVPATVISGGELSTAVGGGISQFATTMFNAVFFAGLEDVFHKPHSFYISRYPAGREATVYEGQIDLVWRNDGETGVFIDTAWTPGTITVTFYGTKRYEIESISGARTNFRKPATQEKVDDGDCIPQSGVQGFDISVTRVFRELGSGAEIRRETFDTSYAAEAVIRCVPPEKKKEKEDEAGSATPTSPSGAAGD